MEFSTHFYQKPFIFGLVLCQLSLRGILLADMAKEKKVKKIVSKDAPNYELALVLPDAASKIKTKAATELIEKIVKVSGGSVLKVDEWGDRQLAYPIDKHTIGTYMIFSLKLDSVGAVNMEAKLRHEETVIRHLLIKVEVKNGKKS